MDNNFEQQFTQNIKSMPVQPAMPANSSESGSKMPLIVSAILAAVVLLETIILIIAVSNYFSLVDDSYDETEFSEAEEYFDENYVYDDNDYLTAFNETCRNSDGSYYKFTTDKNYQYFDNSSTPASSGTYSIERESVVSLSGGSKNGKTLFYAGTFVADGNVIYECENPEEAESE